MSGITKFFVSFGIFIVVLIVSGIYVFRKAGSEAAEYVAEFRPNLEVLADGTYLGEFSYLGGRFKTRVKFIVKDHKLLGCDFEKLYSTPGHSAPYMVSSIIDQTEDLDFDAISGASITSQFAKAAIKNAIENGAE